MRHLPPLFSGACWCALPLADRSAAALAEFLLSDKAEHSRNRLAESLSEDPVLLLWTVCVARRHEGFHPQTVADVSDWLAGHIYDVLSWPVDEPIIEFSSSRQAWAERVAKAYQVAELAARLAAENGTAAVDKARFRGLLCDAGDWLADCCQPPIDRPNPFLPGWPATEDSVSDAASSAVKQAVEMLAGETILSPHPSPLPKGEGTIDVDAIRLRAEEIKQKWLSSDDKLGNYLPRLTVLLARLAALETKFQETVEVEKLEAMAEFAAGAGHEINNPLTVIAGRAQLFLHEESDPERRRSLALVNSQAMRIYEMIADMMLFARPPKPHFTPVDAAKIIDDVIADFQAAAARQETVLSRTGCAGPLEIEADATQLTVAIRAICQNSLEALGHGGRIEVELQAGQNEVTIRVTDNGPGITPDESRHIFDPFYSARQAGRGLGLGLSKCWRIVTNHGGRIDVDSRPNQGATFVLILPRRQM